ncbi:BgTH12-03098 [Blumeria graminis f. sp. triticale]|uniref:BgtA-20115 n=3 Tax=Blumeria graminis TaxID=34373 RepID=A0A9X9MJ09_BLUGR|nr:hypothetical protein BGT96224_A20115 [Blumeria graminis f. sp. tritici 96224]CAD6503433.1 BgTH12-03098 [Blumeria graminis f. sp. triticale]VDB89521.1 BgtA-20115 [Blumeria graminis f. sp. tritici]
MSPSPQPSPLLGAGRSERHHSYSPAPQPHITVSKRDRKRSLLRDSYSTMEDSFSANRDSYYRLHLQTLQIDMNLIGAADPYDTCLLPNDPAEIDKLVRESLQDNKMTPIGPNPPHRAGRIYAEFAQECNDAMEERDAALATLHRNISVKMNEIQSTYNYYQRLAHNEHKALRTTLRDRLINSITSKKARLTKEKEMDISDTTAMLLHPSQFAIANPTSPGGMHGKRATRLRREAEDVPAYVENQKRKRKAPEREESPAQAWQRWDTSAGAPSWLAEKNQLLATQVEAPLYSVEKLFTEKELAMTYNAAALAAHSYIVRHHETDSPVPDASIHSSDGDKSAEAADSSAPDEVPQERPPSHVTRSTRGTFVSGLGIDAFDDVTSMANLNALTRQIPKLPPLLAQMGTRSSVVKTESAPPAAGLSPDDLVSEMELIRRAKQVNDQRGLGRNLDTDEHALRLLSEAAFPKDGRGRERWVASENKDNLPVVPKAGRGRELGGEAMSKQSSRA